MVDKIGPGQDVDKSEKLADPVRRSLMRKAAYAAPTLFTLGLLLNNPAGAQPPCPPEPIGCPPSLPDQP